MLSDSATKHYVRRRLPYGPFHHLTPPYHPLSRDGKQGFRESRRTPPSGDALALAATATARSSADAVTHHLSLMCFVFCKVLCRYLGNVVWVVVCEPPRVMSCFCCLVMVGGTAPRCCVLRAAASTTRRISWCNSQDYNIPGDIRYP